MNYSDFDILPHKYTGLKFGKHSQLEVLGSHKDSYDGQTYMILKCEVCCNDKELFGDGLFRAKFCNLNKGGTPCACAERFRWSKEQQKIRISRLCEKLGFKFHGFAGEDWKGDRTKLVLECKHGVWETTTISHFIARESGCIKCGIETCANLRRLDDQVVISDLLATGFFHPDTNFSRSDRKTSQGTANFWFVDCPDCGETGEGWIGNLKIGSRPCACSKQRAKYGYINGVYDGDNLVALKFGITRNPSTRMYFQNHFCIYEMRNIALYEFESTFNCKMAERECKRSLTCKVIPKQEMEDGYTETTYAYNLDKIIDIYESYGGNKI